MAAATATATLTLRPATANDLGDVVAMLADDELGAGRDRPSTPLQACYAVAFAETEHDPNNRILVAERGGEIVGTAQLTFARQLSNEGSLVAELRSVRIVRHLRGAGLGGQLVALVVALARARG